MCCWHGHSPCASASNADHRLLTPKLCCAVCTHAVLTSCWHSSPLQVVILRATRRAHLACTACVGCLCAQTSHGISIVHCALCCIASHVCYLWPSCQLHCRHCNCEVQQVLQSPFRVTDLQDRSLLIRSECTIPEFSQGSAADMVFWCHAHSNNKRPEQQAHLCTTTCKGIADVLSTTSILLQPVAGQAVCI